MNAQLLQELKEILGEKAVLSGDSLNDRYEHIWQMHQKLKAFALVLPQSTEELSRIMKLCHLHKQQVVIHGGLTNLVGSTRTQEHELVISLERMNKIEEIDTQGRTMRVQAGVILQNIHEAAAAKDLLFPLNFGAKGSAQIGGVVSTNAGGLRVFRFGMTRQLILGLEAVLADGTIVSSLKSIIKDNSAYDIKHLFIGSEGSLGIVTRVVLRLIERPRSRCSAFVGIESYGKVLEVLKYIDKNSSGKLSGYELIWNTSFRALTGEHTQVRAPLPYDYKYYVLLELLGSDQEEDQRLLERLLEDALSAGLIQDAAIAFTQSDLMWFWKIREDVHSLVQLCTYDQHFDISLPLVHIGEYVRKTVDSLESVDQVEKAFAFGHIADGNIHFIVGKKDDSIELREIINEIVYSPLKDLNGSVSAEHGIGEDKKAWLHLCRSEAEIGVMKKLKRSLDPFNLLNRGKVLDM